MVYRCYASPEPTVNHHVESSSVLINIQRIWTTTTEKPIYEVLVRYLYALTLERQVENVRYVR
jgi:hypothetical protein